MFSGFRIEFNEFECLPKYKNYYEAWGKHHLRFQKRKYDETMQSYVKGNSLSAKLITSDWFPTMDVDVFISHSGKDVKEANAFAGWLSKNFGLKCFIDSNVWNNVGDLIKAMTKSSFGKKVKLDDCFQVFGHAYMMLSMSLLKMIDKAEAVFLLNAGNALLEHNKTQSPWIFSEISGSNIIRRKPLTAYRKYSSREEHTSEERMQVILEYCSVSYELDLSNLKKLGYSDLQSWREDYEANKYEYPLDALYEMTGYEEMLDASRRLAECCPETYERIFEAWNPISSVEKTESDKKSFWGLSDEFECPSICMKKCGKRCPWCFDNCIVKRGLS